MSIALKEQGSLEEAIEACKKALSIKPNYAKAYNSMGAIIFEYGKLDEALEAYTKAVAIKPDYTEAWVNGADALEKWNKEDQLAIWLDKGFNSFDKVPANLKFMKCKLLWRKKKFEEGYSLILDIDFDAISKVRKSSYLQLKAKYFEKSKKFDEAFACIAQGNSLVKESKEYLKCNPEQYFQNLKDNLAKVKSSSKKNEKSKSKSKENSDFSPTFLVGFLDLVQRCLIQYSDPTRR